jgi:hypothetical protein
VFYDNHDHSDPIDWRADAEVHELEDLDQQWDLEEQYDSDEWQHIFDEDAIVAIEMKKATYIMLKHLVSYCLSCHPLFEANAVPRNGCKCQDYSHFVAVW